MLAGLNTVDSFWRRTRRIGNQGAKSALRYRSLTMSSHQALLKAVAVSVILYSALVGQEADVEWTRFVEPVYPQMARIAHISGEVWLQAEIDPSGNIVNVRPLSGHPILIAAASDSLRQAKVRCRNCENRNMVFNVRYLFKIDDSARSNPCFDPAGNAQPCGNEDSVQSKRTHSQSKASPSSFTGLESQRTPAPDVMAPPIYQRSLSALRP